MAKYRITHYGNGGTDHPYVGKIVEWDGVTYIQDSCYFDAEYYLLPSEVELVEEEPQAAVVVEATKEEVVTKTEQVKSVTLTLSREAAIDLLMDLNEYAESDGLYSHSYNIQRDLKEALNG